MQYYWLNKQDNDNFAVGRHYYADNIELASSCKKNLIVFFAGWSFDYKPFEFLDCGDCDVLFVYDYSGKWKVESISEGWRYRGIDVWQFNNINFGRISQKSQTDTVLSPYRPIALSPYSRKFLLTWSMGSYVAYQMRDLFKDFDKKIAINGTPFPVDNDYGIPEKPFLLTLRHAKTGLEGKFYQNIFEKTDEYERYLQTPVERSIENRVDELQNLYEKIKNTPKTYKPFFDKAFVSLNDKIIPSKNQLKFWEGFDVPVEKLESGHFPYYNFNSWKEFL